jgi:hypothetical protein
VGFLSQLQTDVAKRYPKPVNPQDGPQPPGRFSFGTQIQGGPTYSDAFRSKRTPGPTYLVENYHALIYAMVAKTSSAVAKVPIRLVMDGSRGQGGPPTRCADGIKLSRSYAMRLAQEDSSISPSAVDQIYEIRNHPLLDVLDRPDPYNNFSRRKFIALLVAYMDVLGSAYIVPEGNGWDWTDSRPRRKGPPENLWVMYPQWVIPVRTGHSPIVDLFWYFSDRLPLQSVLWFRHGISIKDAYGAAFSPTSAGEPYRQQEQELVAVLSQVMGMPPRPSLVLTAKDAIAGIMPAQKLALEQQMRAKFSASGAGGLWVNDGAWDVTPVDYQKADTGAKDISQHDRDNLASIFGMPPTYFTVDSNLANLQAADKQFARFCVEPRLDTVTDHLTVLAQMCDPRLRFVHDPVVAEDEVAKQTVVDMRLRSGLTTPNQENEEGKWPAFPEGDEHWIDSSLKPMSMILAEGQMAQEQHEMGLKQGDQEMASGEQADELAADGHEHQKKMDKEGLAIDKKKASQKPPAAKRSLDERLEEQITAMERSLTEMGVAV